MKLPHDTTSDRRVSPPNAPRPKPEPYTSVPSHWFVGVAAMSSINTIKKAAPTMTEMPSSRAQRSSAWTSDRFLPLDMSAT